MNLIHTDNRHVTIPLASRSTGPNSTSPATNSQETESSHEDHKPLVLIVDDNPDVTLVLTSILEQAGYRVTSADSARNALEIAKREHFDVIVSDIAMPEMDGYEFARSLRDLAEYSATPMIAMTGFFPYSAADNAFGSGFNAFLKKPVEPAKLLEIIARLGH